MPVISIVVPAYNSERTIGRVVESLKSFTIMGHEIEIIVVDDCSTDQTWAKIESTNDIVAIRHPRNTGKGGALRTGFERAKGDYLVIEDDDLEYDPCEIPSVLMPLLEQRAEIVFGSRQLNKSNKKGATRLYYLGGVLINKIAEALLRRNITDCISGTKAFTRRVYEHIAPIECDGFDVEAEIVAKALHHGFTLAEVPIHYEPRSHAEGKNIRWYHAFPILFALLKYARRAER